MDINNFTFTYSQKTAPRHPAMNITHLCIVQDKNNGQKFSTEFDAPPNIDYRLIDAQIFAAFCNNDLFKNRFFIELEEIKDVPKEQEEIAPIEKIAELPAEEKKEIDKLPEIVDTVSHVSKA